MGYDQSSLPSDEDIHRCPSCGHSVRGVESERCPECGAEIFLEIARYDNGGAFNAACAALADADIAFDTVSLQTSSHTFSQLFGRVGGISTGVIRVHRTQIDRAAEILREFDDAPNRPIVDRSEPTCPNCDSSLAPDGDETCPYCGLEFQGVEIEEPVGDTTDKLCVDCGYNLTGVERDRCPECNAPIVFPELVEAEAGLSQSGPSEVWMAITVLAAIATFAALVLAALLSSRTSALLTILFGLVALFCFIRTRPEEHQADRAGGRDEPRE